MIFLLKMLLSLLLITFCLVVHSYGLPGTATSASKYLHLKGMNRRKMISNDIAERKKPLVPALSILQRRKRQISGVVLPGYIGSMSPITQRYHLPFYGMKRNSLPLSNFDKDEYIGNYFKDGSPMYYALPNLEDPEEIFVPDEVQESPVTPSFSKLRSFKHNRLVGILPDFSSGTHREDLPLSHEHGNALYQTLQKIKGGNNVKFPSEWTPFDKNSYNLYVESAINALKEANRKDSKPAERSQRAKRSAAPDAEIQPKSKYEVRKPSDDFMASKNKNEAHMPVIHSQIYEKDRAKRDSNSISNEKKRQIGTQLGDDEETNYLLARKYFKQFAQAVGDRKKRIGPEMEKKIRSEKRAFGLQELLDNPSTLHYAQEKLEESEDDIMAKMEDEIRGKDSQEEQTDEDIAKKVIMNSFTKLNALENMKDSLHQLELLQQQDLVRKRAQDLSIGDMKMSHETEKEKRRKVLQTQRDDDIFSSKKRQLNHLYESAKSNEAECPILDKIRMDCENILQDEQNYFLELCLLHEICYMSGALAAISTHECDARLSSTMELMCASSTTYGKEQMDMMGSMACRKAAGETFDALSDPMRYDEEGLFPLDPCVKDLMQHLR